MSELEIGQKSVTEGEQTESETGDGSETTMSGQVNETRAYNSMLQLTSVSNGSVNIAYNYSSTQNNGKITSQTDNISGEQVVYAYDALNRLASAAATSGSWGQSYAYDGFGNLTDQNVTAGSAPAYHVTPNPSTNHIGSTDANGNDMSTFPYGTYDVANRLVNGGYQTFQYSYAPGNKRVWRGVWSSGTLATDEITFWSTSGQKLATYQLSVTGGVINNSSNAAVLVATQTATNYYFGRKLIKNANGYVGADRLGSIGKYYPYGQEKPSATTNGTEKFTGYFRDAETGLDYADQRFHNPGTGRFLTPDPYMASGGPADPGSWNRYAYVEGDPINYWDPSGQYFAAPGSTGPIYCPGWDPVCEILSGGVGGIGGGTVGGGVCPAGQYFNATSNNCVDDGTTEDPAPAPDCAQILTADITQYLGSYGGPLNSPQNIQTLVQDGMQYDVDPRFIVALAIAESQGGKNLQWGPYNAWGIRARNPGYRGPGKKPPYTSWTQAINAVNDLIAGRQYFGAGLTTTTTIYALFQGPGDALGLGNLNTALGQMQGNQNMLTDPCNPKNLRSPNP